MVGKATNLTFVTNFMTIFGNIVVKILLPNPLSDKILEMVIKIGQGSGN